MNDLLRDKLKVAVSDDKLIMAFRALFEERLKKNEPEINANTDNGVIGAQYRAFIEAKMIINDAFNDLNNYKTGSKPEPLGNRGK